MDGYSPNVPRPLREKAADVQLTLWRCGRGLARFLERRLARKCGAVIAFLSCLALIAALVAQEYARASIGLDRADPMTAMDPASRDTTPAVAAARLPGDP